MVTAVAAQSAKPDTSAAGKLRAVLHPSAQACQRHDPVGFFTAPEVLAELTQVYATCYAQPACANPADLETIQIDGYNSFANWLWTGLSTTLFNVPQQDALVANAVSRAGLVTPAGKVIISISFLRDVITANSGVVYVMYFRVTFARCSQSQNGMTWTHSMSNSQSGTITVGCNGCDPYQGDTPCTQQMPLLCVYKPTPAFPLPVSVNNSDQYNLWAGGVIATSQPVAGSAFANTAAANAYCIGQFGANWRVAEFHDGWGWNFQAYGGTVSAPAVPSTRFWVYINDQSAANCWSP
jgi:hypothetical protein